MPTLITLLPHKPRFTQTTEGSPLAVTATHFATGGNLLRVGTLVVNK